MNYLVEWDDFPRNWEETLDLLKFAKERIPTFRCIVFAIPMEMRKIHWRHLRDKRQWVEVGIHGFRHRRGECRRDRSYGPKISELLSSGPWCPAIKGPFYGFNRNYILGGRENNCTIFARERIEILREIKKGEVVKGCYRSSEKFKSIYYHTNKPRDIRKFASWVESFSDKNPYFLNIAEATEEIRGGVSC